MRKLVAIPFRIVDYAGARSVLVSIMHSRRTKIILAFVSGVVAATLTLSAILGDNDSEGLLAVCGAILSVTVCLACCLALSATRDDR